MNFTSLIASMMVAGLLAPVPAHSAGTAAPQPTTAQGGVSYITGGIGEDETASLKNMAPAYSLEMLFVQHARPRDEFLADVRVVIRDLSGKSLLETTADGPYLLAKLPDGTYNLEAEYRGERKHHVVAIRSGRHQRAVFVWAPRDDSDNTVVGRAD